MSDSSSARKMEHRVGESCLLQRTMLHSGVERLRDQGGLKEGQKSSSAMYALESQIGSCAGDGVMGTTLRLIVLERLRTMSIDVLEGGGWLSGRRFWFCVACRVESA